jgi:hypothetical protein
MKQNNKIYFNSGQRELLAIGANSETIIAARRFGKSDGIIAPRLLRDAQHMPRSAGAIYAATFQQALSRTLPAAVASLKRMGYHNEIHFFIGRKAPKSLGFAVPYIEPQSWDHVMHWYNGSIYHILSQDVKFSANSLTLDSLKVDEGRSINPEKFFDEVVPTVSGMIGYFKNCPWHKGITVVSDMPHGKKGEWLLQRKTHMDIDLLSCLIEIRKEIQKIKYSKDDNDIVKCNRLNKNLNFMRHHLHYYREFDAIDNLELLGESYIKKMKRELTPMVFLTSILNKRITKLVDGFYANLDAKLHYYDAYNNSYLNNLRTDQGSLDIGSFSTYSYLQDSDVDAKQPLMIALDYNANINWIVTGQIVSDEMRTLKSIFVKNDRKLRELINDWCDYYERHPVKQVIYYYDETALQGAYASDNETFADIVIAELRKRSWFVEAVYTGKPMRHSLKHQYINDALTGKKYLFPTFNRNNNEFLLPSLEQAGIKIGRNGFEKDKSGEKLAETTEDPLELRTDGTDAWDNLFIGCNFFRVDVLNTVNMSNTFL